ncbi:MAG: hypothetical protein LR015_14775 [Verrucomicrobia bacterium]|nr:hypothetical protein [Verrucomicrobiota bacterium]
MPEALLFLQDLAIIMMAAAVGGFICRKAGLSPIVGYLLAGLVIGTPHVVFPYVSEKARIEVLAQVGW